MLVEWISFEQDMFCLERHVENHLDQRCRSVKF